MSLRTRYGLRWQRRRPALAEMLEEGRSWLTTAFIVLIIFILYGIVGRMDYEDQLKAEAEAKHWEIRDADYRLARCLNGENPGLHSINSRGERLEVVCEKAWELNIGKTTTEGSNHVKH